MVPGLWLSEGGQSATGKLVRANMMCFSANQEQHKNQLFALSLLVKFV